MKYLLMAALYGLVLVTPAFAAPVPDYVLNKDFENCMGGEDPNQSTQRAAYCNCVRDKMRSWDMDTYGAMATEQSQAGSKPVQGIADMAKDCISQVLK